MVDSHHQVDYQYHEEALPFVLFNTETNSKYQASTVDRSPLD